MKSAALLVAICLSCGPAIAQTNDCQSVPKGSDRLACYDKVTPPTGQGKPAAASQTPAPKRDQAQDPLAAENARLDARINNICRGCRAGVALPIAATAPDLLDTDQCCQVVIGLNEKLMLSGREA